MSVSTMCAPGASLVGLRPTRRVVARRQGADGITAPASMESAEVAALPLWVAAGFRGDVLFPVLVSLSAGELMVCLMGSPMPVGAVSAGLGDERVVSWALSGLRALGVERVRELDRAVREINLAFVESGGSSREWRHRLDVVGGGVVAGAARRRTAVCLGFDLMTVFSHGSDRCEMRGSCRHCYPQVPAGRAGA